MPENKYLKASFDFPERLTVRAKDAYIRVVLEAEAKYGKQVGLTIYNAVVFGAAVSAGLLLNWKSATVPTLSESDLELMDSDITDWAGPLIDNWFNARRHIPKVSFLRRLTTGFARLIPRRPTSTPL